MSESSISVTEKYCAGCATTKPASSFGRNKRYWHGLQDHCRECRSARHAANAEKKAEYDKRYRAENSERIKEYQRRYYEQYRGYVLSRNKRWYEANHEHHNKVSLAYYYANRDTYLRQWKANYEADKEKYIARARANNARKRNADGTHTITDVHQKYEEQGAKCYWCKKPLNGVYHVDHIIPISKGGSNCPANIACSCPFCNLSKGAKMPWEFSDRLF